MKGARKLLVPSSSGATPGKGHGATVSSSSDLQNEDPRTTQHAAISDDEVDSVFQAPNELNPRLSDDSTLAPAAKRQHDDDEEDRGSSSPVKQRRKKGFKLF